MFSIACKFVVSPSCRLYIIESIILNNINDIASVFTEKLDVLNLK